MKVEKINEELLNIFINNYYFKDINMENKNDLINIIKDLIRKIEMRYKLNLNGFYKIKVYPKKELGIFLNIIKIDDNEFSSGADFRIVIYPNEKFFFETEHYEELEKKIKKRYFDNKFYVDIDTIKNLNNIIDMGTIIYGTELKEVLMKSKIIN